MKASPITIVGGGLAGLTLGIGLRQKSIPVTILEAAQYPRHKVCGEFISGRGQDVLEGLGLRKLLTAAGAVPAQSASFHLMRGESKPRPLTPPALCLSRFKMDKVLADEFQKLGGKLREGERVNTQELGDGIVCASGRRRQATDKGWRWFGIKAHARNLFLQSDLEMHLGRDGYIGLCRLADDVVNICGLFRSRPGSSHSSPEGNAILSATRGMPVHERLKRASFDESSFCAVAGLALSPQHAQGSSECRLGDAITMIPPVTGNGMSMAFESAEIAIAPLASYYQRELSWKETVETIGTACDKAFGRRLKWAGVLQALMFSPLSRSSVGKLALRSDWLWRWMFWATR